MDWLEALASLFDGLTGFGRKPDTKRQGIRVIEAPSAHPTRIDRLQPGARAVVFGRVVSAGPYLLAPISARRCVAWTAQIRLPGRDRQRFARVCDFAVIDEGGTIAVHAEQAALNLVPFSSGTGSPLFFHPELRALLGIGAPSLGDVTAEWEEQFLLEGDAVRVDGWVGATESNAPIDAESPYREPPAQRLFMSAAHGPLTIVAP